MVKLRNISERWLIIGISILMVLALAMVARVLANTEKRGERLGMMMLDRSLESHEQRLQLITNSYMWDLLDEADHIADQDSIADLQLIKRWVPVMRNRYPILAITLANEEGDEHVLNHVDSIWRYVKTARGKAQPFSMMSEWPIKQNRVPPMDTSATQADPRRSIWFSQAMENRQDEPTWSESEGPGDAKIMYLSILIRGQRESEEFRVLCFTIDADAMLASLTQWTQDLSTIVLNSKWRPLTHIDTSKVGKAWKEALREGQTDRSPKTFRSAVDQQHWMGRLVPLELNGTRLYTGVMIGSEGLERWNREGRIGLWAVLGLLLLLGLMLSFVLIQNQGVERRMLRHERRSSAQARNLAKAIGEREVLDREVHHRVKNNLQVVSSLLNLQAQRVPGEAARAEFMRGKRRIDSMALVHHKLYRQEDLSAVDMGVFLDDVAKAMAAMFDPDSRSVSHSVETSGIRCDADTSIQLGMILCELLANCHQHAFPYATGGHISISVREVDEGSYVLRVKDNGKGFNPEDVLETHLGLEVVEALADQLDGTLVITSDGGTVVDVTFRSNRYKL